MKTAILSDTSKSVKSVAQNIARRLAQEQVEILKEAKTQISGDGTSTKPEENNPKNQSGEDRHTSSKQEDNSFAQRRMQALQNEMEDIRKGKIFRELQAKISQGETVFLENYPELSMEQKQVLKAQIEAVTTRQLDDQTAKQLQEVPVIHSKPSRRFGAGQKREAEKQQTRIEKPVPPSG